jgi:hypothetical protein
MSNQRPDPKKPETAPEKKKTDTTTMLSAEELRAISGGATQQPPKSTQPTPSTKGSG